MLGVTDFFDVIDGSLMTYDGYTNFIYCNCWDNFTDQELESIKNLIKSQEAQEDNRFSRYIKAYEDTFGTMAKIPTETTNCWCLMDKDNELLHKQFVANITGSVAMDISSHAFVDHNMQHGTMFFGSLFSIALHVPICY